MENTRMWGAYSSERYSYLQSMQRARVGVITVLIGLSAIELSLLVIYFYVMPIFLILLNIVCLMTNGFLVMALTDVYRRTRTKLNKHNI